MSTQMTPREYNSEEDEQHGSEVLMIMQVKFQPLRKRMLSTIVLTLEINLL